MTVLISCTDQDRKAAGSLERFLKGQAMPVRMTSFNDLGGAIRSGGPIVMLWSRSLAGSSLSRARSEAVLTDSRTSQRVILVNLDGSEIPWEVRNHQVVDARSVGHRQGRTWRRVAAMARSGSTDIAIDDATVEIAEIASEVPDIALASSPLVIDDGLGRVAAASKSMGAVPDNSLTRPIAPMIVLFLLMAGLSAAAVLLAGPTLLASIQ